MTRPPAFQETIAPPPLAWAVLAGLLLLPIGFMAAALARDPDATPVLLPAMVFVLALVGVLVWPCRLRLDARGLHLRHGLFRHTVPLAELDPTRWRKVDLDQERGSRPLLRTMGTGLPRFRGGWYRLRDRRRAFVLINRWTPAWIFEPASGPVVLLTPGQGSRFIEAIRSLQTG
ncbi:MAG: hypothetical protein KF823_03470 [Xanthomonadales bacterium]|nr:hypothetical protein [Xanthomonadales bacterium]